MLLRDGGEGAEGGGGDGGGLVDCVTAPPLVVGGGEGGREGTAHTSSGHGAITNFIAQMS